MSRIGELEDLLEEKGKIEREDAISLFHLRSSLQEIEESHARLEEQLDTIEESHNVAHSKIVKDRDMYFARNKIMQKDKDEFVIGHVRLIEDMEKLVDAHKALESEHSSLKVSHAQLQTRLANLEKPSTSTTICACENANLLKENARLKVELSKASMTKITLLKGKHVIEAPIYEPHTRKGREGLGYVPPEKVNVKKTTPPQAKKITTPNVNATRGTHIRDDFAGDNNPNYSLYTNYYGNVCARYIGPYDGFIHYAIWVPKTLVANKKAPIVKQWVPKMKN
jgi:prefoldin subunit 5